jgi:Domain of unknown function (DUF3291)
MVAGSRIAHFNAARLLHAPSDPRVAGFVDNISKVNSVAERSKGYVWRLAEETSLVAQEGYGGEDGDPKVVFSLSVWESLDDFELFVHKTVHATFLRRRQEWFEPWNGPNYVIWDFRGRPPVSREEGWSKLKLLADHGPSELAYDLKYARAARSAY